MIGIAHVTMQPAPYKIKPKSRAFLDPVKSDILPYFQSQSQDQKPAQRDLPVEAQLYNPGYTQ